MSPRLRAAVLVGAVCAAALLAVGCAEGHNRRVVRAFLDAHNAGSAGSMAALVAPDVEIEGPDGSSLEGRAAAEDLFEWFVAIGSRIDAEVVSSSADGVVELGPLEQTSLLHERLGVSPVRFEAGTRFELDGGLILRIRVTQMTRESRERFQDALTAFLEWASANAPQGAAALAAADAPRDAAQAALWLELLDRRANAGD